MRIYATVIMVLTFLYPSIDLQALTSSVQAAEPIPLRAGPVSMVFDVEHVFLRYIRIGPHEILRGITAPIRDSNWATVAPVLSNLKIENHGDSFQVDFDVDCQEADIDFRWKGTITGSVEGVVEYTFAGEAHSTFKRNRIGFCVLHGPSAAGQPWVIETADGKTSQGNFPKFISPHQPAKNLRAISHEVAPGIHARVDFEGDVFEMEDQRNWTDASFKTYCTPLELPYPAEVLQGTKILQKIRISPSGDISESYQVEKPRTVITLGSRQTALPGVGLQVSNEVENLTDNQVDRLKALHLHHLRVDLALSNESFVNELRRATQQARALGVPLNIGLNLGETPAFDTLLKEIAEFRPLVSAWLVTSLDPAQYETARLQLAPVVGKAVMGVTEITNFVELNRTRPTSDLVKAIGFGINPQIHAFDNASMIETLPIQADAVDSARQFSGARRLFIGPVTLAPQFVNGEDPPGGPPSGPLPTYIDARQVEPFAAVWTLGSLKYLAEAGADNVTYYETIGWNGVMDADDVSDRSAAFPSRPGETFPIYQLLEEVGAFAGGQVTQCDSSDQLSAVGLAIHHSGRLRVLLGNLTGSPQTVTLRGVAGEPITLEILGNAESKVVPEVQVDLPPYGIARIDRVMN
ncbi:MAG: hypothetical protein ABI557_11395, partial [Aureliella sp.]